MEQSTEQQTDEWENEGGRTLPAQEGKFTPIERKKIISLLYKDFF